MQRTAFIINPNSSNGKYQSFLNKLIFLIDNPNVFISKSKKDTEDFINNNLNNIDIFVAVGGDGTISSIAKQLIYTDKILAVYPMGSGNGFAKENGFDKSIKKLLTKIQNKKSQIIDTIKINQEFSINVSGVGLDSVVAYNFEKTSRGFFNYIKTELIRRSMMEIKISNLSSVPIYQQVATQIKSNILNGSLKNNDQLPSIRSLAKELEVGIITVKKSYEVLLQEELIYSKGAVGYFVNDIDLDTVLTIKKEEYSAELKSIIDKAINDGLNINDIRDIFNSVMEENSYDKS